MNATLNVAGPANSLQEEITLTSQLVDILKREQAHLIAADINGLKAVTEEKSQVVSKISALTAQRYHALKLAGFDAMEGGMRAWIKSSKQLAEVDQAWANLLQLAQTVKNLNNTNGLLIGKHITYNQNALNVLQGTRATGFYGPDGQTTNKLRQRGLVVG